MWFGGTVASKAKWHPKMLWSSLRKKERVSESFENIPVRRELPDLTKTNLSLEKQKKQKETLLSSALGTKMRKLVYERKTGRVKLYIGSQEHSGPGSLKAAINLMSAANERSHHVKLTGELKLQAHFQSQSISRKCTSLRWIPTQRTRFVRTVRPRLRWHRG